MSHHNCCSSTTDDGRFCYVPWCSCWCHKGPVESSGPTEILSTVSPAVPLAPTPPETPSGDTYEKLLRSWREYDECMQKIANLCWSTNDPSGPRDVVALVARELRDLRRRAPVESLWSPAPGSVTSAHTVLAQREAEIAERVESLALCRDDSDFDKGYKCALGHVKGLLQPNSPGAVDESGDNRK